ncbi:DNA polymerase alpha/epsilon subunit B-domain-containing protein [Infundibulicybe gibba]|nr:DNA polymerase alpha/epsilon subunit B-domain-containing protein [Infundibulicybe gibba]
MASIDPLPIPPISARSTTAVLPPGDAPSFRINTTNRSYKHQYANIYFLRLKALRAFVEERARTHWKDVAGHPKLVPRVLEVVKSQLCYVIGTIYMDMPLKPNVMEDIARDRSIPPPPPRSKFHSPEDQVMLEDESGRIQLSGKRLQQARLVTGIIVGVLGMETPDGEFEVVDLCFPDLAPQPSNGAVAVVQDEEMDIDGKQPDEWIAVVSGFEIGSLSPSDALIQLLVEYLTGEQGGPTEQLAASQISRLIIAGNSLAPVILTGKGEIIPNGEEKKARRYGYDATNFSPHPTISFSAHLLDIARVMPVHLLPGETDPSGTILPQQPFPRAMFGQVASLPTFVCETNPTYLRLGAGLGDSRGESEDIQPEVERSILVHSGQPLDDMFKYLPSPPNTRLAILESTLRWRHMAPTALKHLIFISLVDRRDSGRGWLQTKTMFVRV